MCSSRAARRGPGVGWTQGELASRSSLKPNTVGAVLRGDPNQHPHPDRNRRRVRRRGRRTVRRRGPRAADHWTAALEHLDAAGRTLAATNVDATSRPELTPDAAADVERAALAAHRAL